MTGTPLGAALMWARRLAVPVIPEWVDLAGITGRVLADDVLARADLPATDSAVMDGWAVRASDTPGRMHLVGESRAGAPWAGVVDAGDAVRISTGALVPPGADSILRVEDGVDDGSAVTTDTPLRTGRDIRYAAEDLRAGHMVLRAGTRMDAHRVGVLAATGHEGALCRMPPDVAIVTTGSELVEPGGRVDAGTVFDSNRHGLAAQVRAAGGRVVSAITVEDDPEMVRRALADTLPRCDLLVVAGGLSVGRHDHVRSALTEIGMRPEFSRMAMRPGRPTTVGVIRGHPVLAVPGNPAAAAIGMHLLGRALLGTEVPWTRLPLGGDCASRGDIDEILRCRERDGIAEPLAKQGSGSVSSLADADALAWLPWGRSSFPAGTLVAVSRL